MAIQATISSSVAVGLRPDVARLDIDAGELVRLYQFPLEANVEKDREIPLCSFVSALEYVARTGRCGDFGWRAGRCFDIRHLGDLGETMASAPTLGAALQLFARYLRLIQSTSELTCEIADDEVVVNYRILDPDIWPRCQDAEFTISVLCALMRRCLGEDWRPLYLGFEHDPVAVLGTRDEDAGIACAYGCDANTIVLPSGALDAAMPEHDRDGWPAAFARLNRAVSRHDKARPIQHRVRSIILSELGTGMPCQSLVARRLGLSPRTLHRRLDAEKTSYGEILAECRSRLARSLLVRRRRPLSQVAQDLGYSDYSAFSRAFKAAFGTTPKVFRDRNTG